MIFRMDWLDLLAVQGTLKSLQHHTSKSTILQCSAFFTVQVSHPYMTTGKTVALTRQTLVGKVMSLLLNILPRLVITFAYVSEGVMLCLCNGNGPAQASICNSTLHIVSQVLYTLTFLWQTLQRYMLIFCLTEKESKTQRKIHNLAKIPKALCTWQSRS